MIASTAPRMAVPGGPRPEAGDDQLVGHPTEDDRGADRHRREEGGAGERHRERQRVDPDRAPQHAHAPPQHAATDDDVVVGISCVGRGDADGSSTGVHPRRPWPVRLLGSGLERPMVVP